jgi:hypothetical protein
MVTGLQHPNRLLTGILVFTMSLLNSFELVKCQEVSYRFYYRIYFRDKGTNSFTDFSPYDLLSDRAIERRQKMLIDYPDTRDIPVYSEYLDQIRALGLTLHCTSRWMNTGLFKTEVMTDVSCIMNLPFVSDVRIVKAPGSKNLHSDKLSFNLQTLTQQPYNQPLVLLNGLSVHNSGLNGKGILIAVLDGGFLNADNITSINSLRIRNGIKGTFCFVENDKFVYGFNDHGTAILSVLAGNIPESIEGTARDADFLLLRSEDPESEFPVEEDFWTAAAEYADSAGADIITSSLGYSTFDDPLLNYKYSDMNGNTSFITRAADVAASKGILVVNSAGNERRKTWIRITAPSDGDSVLAVGAVDGYGTISAFSSAGPSFDGRIKPDLAAQGVSVPVQVRTEMVERSDGTSFACPLISGMCACIMQAVPVATCQDIISALRTCSDKFHKPDSLYGYGIPDINKAITLLQDKYFLKPAEKSIAGPNPFKNEIKITFRDIPGSLGFELFDTAGKLVLKNHYREFISRTLILDDLHYLKPGMYFLRIKTINGISMHKIIKASNPV